MAEFIFSMRPVLGCLCSSIVSSDYTLCDSIILNCCFKDIDIYNLNTIIWLNTS